LDGVLALAREVDDLEIEMLSLRCRAISATGAERPDAIESCTEALTILYEQRYWQKLWQAMESTALSLGRSGRTIEAATLLGHLDAHRVPAGMEEGLGFRTAARALVPEDAEHRAAAVDGAAMSADEIVVATLDALRSASSSTPVISQ